MNTPDPTVTAGPLDAVIAEYLQSVEAGLVPNRQALLEAHVDLADELLAFFANLDRMDRVASPLRMDAPPDATSDLGESTPATPIRVRYFGDYELIEEIARGGMGIVYKARQVSLNRIVALKMVLKGALATPRDVSRFRAEAEAVANLDHPNIIPIYEVGDHDGLQYFSMKFVEGGTLGGAPRLGARAEVSRILTIARAVSFAHLRGILHRDLKPSNVLLDVDGTPFVTDFGLAKRLTDLDRSQTESGQFIGTPKYMAPEQAAARKDLTLAADVYSLGVILYERLSGRPPFTGDDILTILRQVREATPPPLALSAAKIDRDLETIARKCLEKLPTARYPTAEALADDLDRWYRGEPILARPVGQMERAWRWCKRNPAVAGLTAGVGMCAIVAIFFAVLASHRATRAEMAEHDAVDARDNTERSLAQSLVGPLDSNYMYDAGYRQEPLTLPESEALWKLARFDDNRIWLRFLDEATLDPVTTSQLQSCSQPAMIAAVGLDSLRRTRASELFQKRLRDSSLSLPQRFEIACTALELEDRSGPVTEEYAKVLSQVHAADFSEDVRREWIYHILGNLDHLEPKTVASRLFEALEQETDPDALERLANGLALVALRLEQTESARVCSTAARVLSEAVPRATYNDGGGGLGNGLSSLATRLEPTESARVLSEALLRATDDYDRRRLADGLSRMAARLEPTESVRVLSEALTHETTDPFVGGSLADGLSSMAARLEPMESVRVLSDALQRETIYGAHRCLAKGLSSMAARLEPTESARVLFEALPRAIELFVSESLAEELSSVALRLEPKESARVCGATARVLSEALQRGTHAHHYRRDLAHGLSSIAARLELAESTLVCGDGARSFSEALQRATASGDRKSLAEGLSFLAARLEPRESARVCGAAASLLFDALKHGTEIETRKCLAECLSLLAPQLEPTESARLCDAAARTLFDTLQNEIDADAIAALAEGLSSLTSRLEPMESARVCGAAARVLSDALKRGTSARDRRRLAECLSLLAPQLEPTESLRVLSEALGGETDDSAGKSLAEGLLSMASRLEPMESVSVLSDALQRETSESAHLCLAKGLSSLASRLAPKESLGVLSRSLQRETDAEARRILAEGLSSIASRLEPAEASRLCNDAIDSIIHAQSRKHVLPDASLATLIRQLDSGKANELARNLIPLLCAEPDAGISDSLLNALLTDASRATLTRRAIESSPALGLGVGLVPRMAARAAEPLPCRLTTQELVDLLKMPTCFGPARRVVLDHLGDIHHRRFLNHWSFVRFAEENHLGLDLKSPPKRPRPISSN